MYTKEAKQFIECPACSALIITYLQEVLLIITGCKNADRHA